jgi:transcriptional regulator with XRE-family HTH domain
VDETERVCRNLGQRVIELRIDRELTQEALAEKMQIEARDLRRIEAGDNVTVHTLVRLARALGVDIPALFDPPKMKHRRRPGRPARSDKR